MDKPSTSFSTPSRPRRQLTMEEQSHHREGEEHSRASFLHRRASAPEEAQYHRAGEQQPDHHHPNHRHHSRHPQEPQSHRNGEHSCQSHRRQDQVANAPVNGHFPTCSGERLSRTKWFRSIRIDQPVELTDSQGIVYTVTFTGDSKDGLPTSWVITDRTQRRLGPKVADIHVEELLAHSCSSSDCPCKSNCREMTKAFACRRGCFEGRKMCIIGLVLHAVTHSSFWKKPRQEFHCRKCGFPTPLANVFMKHAYESPCQLVQTKHMFMFAFFFMEDPTLADFRWEMGEELWESMKSHFQRPEDDGDGPTKKELKERNKELEKEVEELKAKLAEVQRKVTEEAPPPPPPSAVVPQPVDQPKQKMAPLPPPTHPAETQQAGAVDELAGPVQSCQTQEPEATAPECQKPAAGPSGEQKEEAPVPSAQPGHSPVFSPRRKMESLPLPRPPAQRKRPSTVDEPTGPPAELRQAEAPGPSEELCSSSPCDSPDEFDSPASPDPAPSSSYMLAEEDLPRHQAAEELPFRLFRPTLPAKQARYGRPDAGDPTSNSDPAQHTAPLPVQPSSTAEIGGTGQTAYVAPLPAAKEPTQPDDNINGASKRPWRLIRYSSGPVTKPRRDPAQPSAGTGSSAPPPPPTDDSSSDRRGWSQVPFSESRSDPAQDPAPSDPRLRRTVASEAVPNSGPLRNHPISMYLYGPSSAQERPQDPSQPAVAPAPLPAQPYGYIERPSYSNIPGQAEPSAPPPAARQPTQARRDPPQPAAAPAPLPVQPYGYIERPGYSNPPGRAEPSAPPPREPAQRPSGHFNGAAVRRQSLPNYSSQQGPAQPAAPPAPLPSTLSHLLGQAPPAPELIGAGALRRPAQNVSVQEVERRTRLITRNRELTRILAEIRERSSENTENWSSIRPLSDVFDHRV